MSAPPITASDFDALLVELDGVVADTTPLHARAWKRMFDEFLRRFAATRDLPFHPFTLPGDYHGYVESRPREEGLMAFLESRRIVLPVGDRNDPADADTVAGLSNRKHELVLAEIERGGVQPHAAAVELLRDVRALGLRTAVVSSSRSMGAVLERAGIRDLFDVTVDGIDAIEHGLNGKPEPDTVLAALDRLGVEPGRAASVEGGVAGVEASVGAGVGLVIAVGTGEEPEIMTAHGADLVVDDVREVRRDAPT